MLHSGTYQAYAGYISPVGRGSRTPHACLKAHAESGRGRRRVGVALVLFIIFVGARVRLRLVISPGAVLVEGRADLRADKVWWHW